jgi:hypothetical protein
MKSWQRLSLALMIGSFPAAIFLLNRPTRSKPQETTPSIAETKPQGTPVSAISPKSNFNSREVHALDRGIDSKVREMKEIDIKITETRGEIIRLEEKKGSVRKDLEALQARLAPIINSIDSNLGATESENADRREPSGKSARADLNQNDIR